MPNRETLLPLNPVELKCWYQINKRTSINQIHNNKQLNSQNETNLHEHVSTTKQNKIVKKHYHY